VCAVRDGSVVLMSADTAATSETGRRSCRRDSKMFRLRIPIVGGPAAGSCSAAGGPAAGPAAGRKRKRQRVQESCEMLVGLCGEYHRMQLAACAFRPPPMRARQDPWAYLAGSFVPSLKKFLISRFSAGKADSFMDGESCLLIAFQSRIFTMYCNGQLEETREGYASIGGGEELALGAMYCAAAAPEATSWEVLDWGMHAAEAFHSTVKRPFETEILFSTYIN